MIAVDTNILVYAHRRDSQWHAALIAAKISGPAIHDARIATICTSHRVSELLTADREFGRFPALRTRNPLVAES